MKFLIVLSLIVVITIAQDLPTCGGPVGNNCGVPKSSFDASSRIVNGEEAKPNEFTFQGLLVVYANNVPQSYCGCSFITKTHALTAAHCVVGKSAADVWIFPGVHQFPNLTNPASRGGIQARSLAVHESYQANGLVNDVTVVRLSTTLVLSDKVGLICLPEKEKVKCPAGTPCMAIGWGATTGNRSIPSRPEALQKVGLACVDQKANSDCKQLTHVLGIIDRPQQMCAYAPSKAVCFGDSGGPLFRERANSPTRCLEQIGIMSGTIDCSLTKSRPDVYADVSNLKAWIVAKIKATP